MSGTKILWGQIALVLSLIVLSWWAATQSGRHGNWPFSLNWGGPGSCCFIAGRSMRHRCSSGGGMSSMPTEGLGERTEKYLADMQEGDPEYDARLKDSLERATENYARQSPPQ